MIRVHAILLGIVHVELLPRSTWLAGGKPDLVVATQAPPRRMPPRSRLLLKTPCRRYAPLLQKALRLGYPSEAKDVGNLLATVRKLSRHTWDSSGPRLRPQWHDCVPNSKLPSSVPDSQLTEAGELSLTTHFLQSWKLLRPDETHQVFVAAVRRTSTTPQGEAAIAPA